MVGNSSNGNEVLMIISSVVFSVTGVPRGVFCLRPVGGPNEV